MKLNDFLQDNLSTSYKAYFDGQIVGSCEICVLQHRTVSDGEQQVYPKTWFVKTGSAQLKPVLEIAGLETINHVRQGYGRLILQQIYALSKQLGCAGRMQLVATFGAGPFYEQYGFIGMNPQKDGLKVFNPSAKNVQKLFQDTPVGRFVKLVSSQDDYAKNQGVKFDKKMGEFILKTTSGTLNPKKQSEEFQH